MRISTIAALQDNLIFTIGMGQLYACVEALGIEHLNALSPFKVGLMAKEPLLESTKALLDDKAFIRAIKLLATPEVTVDIKGNGRLDGNYASAVYVKAATGDINALWTQRDANGHLTLICFKDFEEWLRFYIYSRGYTSEFAPAEPLSMRFSMESLLLFFHALDCYQHAYYYELLNFRAFDGNFISEQDFFQLLEKGCQTNDLRWLVPAAIHCVPWVKGTPTVAFTGDHLEVLAASGLLTPIKGQSEAESGFYYGAQTLYMGLEFAAFRKDVAGLRVSTLEGDTLRGLLIATEESLHWFNVGENEITHRAIDTHELLNLLLNTAQNALK